MIKSLRGSNVFEQPPGGFTLLEVIIVMTLIVIMLGITGLSVGVGLKKERLRSATKDIITAVRYAKARANIERVPVKLTIDLDNKALIIKNKRRVLYHGIDIWVIDPDGGEIRQGLYSMVFYPAFGSSGGDILLESSGKRYIIRIDPLTSDVIFNKES